LHLKITTFYVVLYKPEVQYMASKEEQAADALQAGAGHSIHIRVHREEMKGGRRKLHIVNFTICVTSNTGTRRGAVGRDSALQARRLPIRFPTVLLT